MATPNSFHPSNSRNIWLALVHCSLRITQISSILFHISNFRNLNSLQSASILMSFDFIKSLISSNAAISHLQTVTSFPVFKISEADQALTTAGQGDSNIERVFSSLHFEAKLLQKYKSLTAVDGSCILCASIPGGRISNKRRSATALIWIWYAKSDMISGFLMMNSWIAAALTETSPWTNW